MKEVWLPVLEWEGLYEVSNYGQVRSLDRVVAGKSGSNVLKRGRTLRQTNHRGYLTVRLRETKTNRDRTVKVHILVLEAFDKPRPEGMVTRHLNGDSHDNKITNLVWGTVSENNIDRVIHGTHHNAAKTHCANGHKYTPSNTYIEKRKDGGLGRHCKICRSERGLIWRKNARINSN